MNEGTCNPDSDQSYTCSCLDGYSGRNCEEFMTQRFGFNYLVSHVRMTWDDARFACEDKGYTVATVSSLEELSFIAQIPS